MRFSVSSPCTLLAFLQEQFPEASSSSLRKWLAHDRVAVNGTSIRKASHSLSAQDEVRIVKHEAQKKGPLNILYEDKYFVIVNKPEGLLSVRAETSVDPSVHSYLKERHPRVKVWVVHRLDKDTSGVIAFALDEQAYIALKDQLKIRTMKRTYLMLVEGVLEGSGTWDTWLKEDPSFTMRCVAPLTEGAERAITHWKSIAHDNKTSLIECSLVTGKKNQIRVQAQYAQHPIVGDMKYGSSRKTARIFLHACSLECTHPISGQPMAFYAPLPDSFFLSVSSKLQKILLDLKNILEKKKKEGDKREKQKM